MSKYDLAVFDVDGTLLDTSEGIISSVLYTIERFKLDRLSVEQIKNFIGPPIKNSFEKIYGIHGAELQEMTDCFRNRYSAEDLFKAKAYEGIYEVFDGLRKRSVTTAIATYKRHDYAVSIMRHFEFDKFSDIIFGADNDNKLKKKDIIEKCIEVSGVADRKKIVMIGDSDNDAIGARQLGVDFIAVTYGFGFHCKDDCNSFENIGIAERPVDILDLIK